MGSKWWSIRLAAFSISLFVAVAPLLPARGQEKAPRPPSPDTRFGVKAANLGKTTLQEGHFAYSIPADSEIKDALVLINYSDEPLTFSIYPADMGSAASGGLAPAQKDDEMEHVGKWTSLDDSELSAVGVGPKSQRTVPFTLRVPRGTPPGDYPGAIVAALNVGRSSNGLGVQTRAALLVDLNVIGKANLNVKVSQPRVKADNGGYRLDVDVRNTGNVLFTMIGEVELQSGDKTIERVALSPKELYVIPDGRATLSGVWKDPPLFGRVKAVAHVTAIVNRQQRETFSGPPKMLTLLPLLLAGVILAATALLATAVIGTRGIRRRRANRRQEEREILRQYREGQPPREASRFGSSPARSLPRSGGP